MKCVYCGKDDATVEAVFMDSGCQVGMDYVCLECKETRWKDYLKSTGFEEIGSADDYDSYTGRPQHGTFGIINWFKELFK